MLWMLLVYLMASNGYQGQPTLTPSFHGATYSTKEDCEAAAHTVAFSAPHNIEDIGKIGFVTVCAPVNPPAPPSAKAAEDPPPQSSTLLLYPPPKQTKHKR